MSSALTRIRKDSVEIILLGRWKREDGGNDKEQYSRTELRAAAES